MNYSTHFSQCLLSQNLTNSYETTRSARYWSEISLLSTFNVFVIIGNCLVLLAMAIDRHLRTPTHYFIGSLAIADLALGIFVLPFATTLQIRGYWTFGSFFCQVWLAFDVWLCTASIYSLIAVTFDRFIAVTKPLTYKLIMTRRKATFLILVVWLAALIICLPAFAFSLQHTSRLANTRSATATCQCTQMAHSAVYIAYSSTGSFYLPMLVILYLYARIYATVRKIKLSGSTGIVSMAKSAMAGGAAAMAAAHAGTANLRKSISCQHEPLERQLSATLRVHRGKYQPANPTICATSASPKKCNNRSPKKMVQTRYCSLNDLKLRSTRLLESSSRDRVRTEEDESHEMIHVERVRDLDDDDSDLHNPLKTDPLDRSPTPSGQTNRSLKSRFIDHCTSLRYLTVNSTAGSYPSTTSNSPRGSIGGCSSTTAVREFERQISTAAEQSSTMVGDQSPATAAADLWLHIIMPAQLTSMWCQRMAVFQKYQRKFSLELKALKTCMTITGCFFACWLGFCIVYTMQALPYCRPAAPRATASLLSGTGPTTQLNGPMSATVIAAAAGGSYSSLDSCVPDWVTNLMIWLGYVNSALNPIIYGVSNKQFRKTFRRIVRCEFWTFNGGGGGGCSMRRSRGSGSGGSNDCYQKRV